MFGYISLNLHTVVLFFSYPPHLKVEINEDLPNEANWAYLLLRFCYSRESEMISWVCQRFKGRQQVGKLYTEKRTEFCHALNERYFHKEVGKGLTRSSDIFCDRFGSHIWFSVVGPELRVGQTYKKEGGKLAVIDLVLIILDGLLQGQWFGFLGWLLQRLWVRVLLSYMGWPWPTLYSFSH